MDSDIRAAVHKALVTDRLVDADDIVVVVFNGEVSLDGTVPARSASPIRSRSRAARTWPP